MNRNEALEFLELSEEAADTQIKERVKELKAIYEQIIEESTSDFLRRINLIKLEKIQEILAAFPEWRAVTKQEAPAPVSEMEAVLSDMQGQAEEETTDATIILSYTSKPDDKDERPLSPAGWLIRHTEGKDISWYPLEAGPNYIGRKAPASLKNFILIDDDDYLSRVHAVIEVENEDGLQFYLNDIGGVKGEKPSRNGTYLNGHSKRVNAKARLDENDTIQIGITKFVVKYNQPGIDIGELCNEVAAGSYMNTVMIDV
ncbi:MAG: FHA domain-containing protein [Chitinophagaceae bacterium]|nr:FHA domain-containing protein [Chitinophagaceae bacterium]